MKLHKKVVLIVLSAAFSGILTGMESKKKYFVTPKTESGKYALQIAQLARIDSNHSFSSVEFSQIRYVASWLSEEKNKCREWQWTKFVNQFVDDIEKLKPLCVNQLEQQKLTAMIVVIKEITSSLQEGQDCSFSLLDRLNEVIDNSRKAKY